MKYLNYTVSTLKSTLEIHHRNELCTGSYTSTRDPSRVEGQPVKAQSVRREEEVLGHVASRDVHQDVPGHHLHERGAAPHPAGAGEARALHGAGAAHRLVDGERQRGGRRHRLWMRDMEVRFNTFIEVFQRRPTLCFLVKKNARPQKHSSCTFS